MGAEFAGSRFLPGAENNKKLIGSDGLKLSGERRIKKQVGFQPQKLFAGHFSRLTSSNRRMTREGFTSFGCIVKLPNLIITSNKTR